MAAYFADTSFWIALSRERDQYHGSALAWNRFLQRSKSTILTTEAVLWEWLNALSDPATRQIAALGYHRVHTDPRIEVVPMQSEPIDTAIALYQARPDKEWSLTDCLSFVVMQHRGMSDALTTDRHFRQANLKALMLDEPPHET